MALSAGLDLPIINPLDAQLMATIDAFNVLYNYDHDASVYIEHQSNQETVVKKETANFSLNDIVLHGLKDEAANTTKKLLETTPGLEIINNILIPALDTVGKQYEKNIIFLPQLIQSAETAKIAFSTIKETFKETTATKGPIIMATVHGDIHDIGKNIVKVVLESYGYKVSEVTNENLLEHCKLRYWYNYIKASNINISLKIINDEDTIERITQRFEQGFRYWNVAQTDLNLGDVCIYENVDL